MAIKKKYLFIFSLVALMFLSTGLFVGCDKGTELSASGNGQIIEEKVDGQKICTAVADEWNDFIGWYNGDNLYTDDETIILSSKTPKRLKAVFASSGEQSIDRFLNGFYNNIKGLQQSDYFNFENKIEIKRDESEIFYLTIAGDLAITGEENLIRINVKNKKNEEKIDIFIKNTQENTKLYLKINSNKYSYDIPQKFSQIGNFSNLMSVEKLSGENYSFISKILGHKNLINFVKKNDNSKHLSSMELGTNKILDFTKNFILPNIPEDDIVIKELIEIFTKKYQGIGREIPEMTLRLNVEYDGEGRDEKISGFNGKFSLSDDYKLDFGDVITVEKTDIKFKLVDSDYGYSNSTTITSEGEFRDINIFNLSLEGKVDFLYQNPASLKYESLDTYEVVLHSDLNPFSIQNAFSSKKVDWGKIDWQNLGYLNLRMSLVETSQNAIHNGATDYVNVLIDSKKFGANVLVYAGMYNPKMNLISESYVLNNTFYLPKIMATYGDSLQEAFPEDEKNQGQTSVVVDAIKGVVSFIANNESTKLNDVVYKLLSGLLEGQSQEIQNSFFVEDGRIILKTADVKGIISDGMANFSTWLGYSNFNNNIFGSTTSHIAFDFERFSYGNVDTQTKESDISLYNAKHNTIYAISDSQIISGIDDYDFKASADYKVYLKTLVGKDKTLKCVFSDGGEANTFVDYKNTLQNTTFTIWNVEVLKEEENRARIAIYLTYTKGALAQSLYNNDIPYGLIKVERTIEI